MLNFAAGLADALDEDHSFLDGPEWAQKKVGVHLWSKQREIFESVEHNRKTAVQAAHGVGKTLCASTIATWWIDTHPIGEAIVITTAPTSAQVHAIMWEEIRKLHDKGELQGDAQLSDNWVIGRTLVGMGRKPQDYADSAFQGIHRKYVLAILDEAGGIPPGLWNAVDAITTGAECRVLAIGNPDNPNSHFAKVCQKDPTWNKIKISLFDSPNFTGEDVPRGVSEVLTSPEWVEDKRQSWGEDSPLWTAKILGEFPSVDEFAVIPISWVEAAKQRWLDLKEAGTLYAPESEGDNDGGGGATYDKSGEGTGGAIIGVDVARFGTDRTVLATRWRDRILDITGMSGTDTQTVADATMDRMDKSRDVAVIDVVGVGAGVFDVVNAQGYEVEPFNAGAGTKETDESGELTFSDIRSAAWWRLRDKLDPAKGATLALPPNDTLEADLVAPRWEPRRDKIKVESKDAIRKRIGRSTDYADAVIQAVWLDEIPPTPDIPEVYAYEDPAIDFWESNEVPDPELW